MYDRMYVVCMNGWMDGLHTYKHTFIAYIIYMYTTIVCKRHNTALRVLFLISDFSSHISYETNFKNMKNAIFKT